MNTPPTRRSTRLASKEKEVIDVCTPSSKQEIYFSDESSSYASSPNSCSDDGSLYENNSSFDDDDSSLEENSGYARQYKRKPSPKKSTPKKSPKTKSTPKSKSPPKPKKSTPKAKSPPNPKKAASKSKSPQTSPQKSKPTSNCKPTSYSVPDKENATYNTTPSTKKQEEYTKEQVQAADGIISANSKGLSFYDILSVGEDSTEAQIKKSYFKIARKIHPDKNRAPNSSEAFKVVGNAYDVLKSPTKRAAYDHDLNIHQPPPPPPPPTFNEYSHGFSLFNTIPIGMFVTVSNVNVTTNGIRQYGSVVHYDSFSGKYTVRYSGLVIDAYPSALFQNILVQPRWDKSVKDVRVVSYLNGLFEVSYLYGNKWMHPNDVIIPRGNIVHLAVAAPMYNGKYGMIVNWTERFDDITDEDTSFYDVQLSASKTIRVKMANVRL